MTILTQMRVMEIREGTLAMAKRPMPEPRAGEVLIRVAYAGLNRADLFQLQGSYHAPEGASDSS